MAQSSSSAAIVDSSGLRQRKPEGGAAVAQPPPSSSDGRNGDGSAAAAAKTEPAAAAAIDGAKAVDYHFKLSAVITVVWYVLLVALMYLVVPSERIESLEGIERTAATLAAATLGVSCLSTIHRSFSGVIAAALVVQLCAVVTDVLMAAAPVPVLIDQVTGARVHMLRWCEFAPLAFLMTLLTEGGDMANDPVGGVRTGYIQAICQGVSTSFGLLFPFMPGIKSWCFCLACALSLFLPIFFRLAEKLRKIRSMDPKGKTYRRSILCLRLLIVEAVVWTLLVVGYLSCNVLPAFFKGGIFAKLGHPAVTMVYDCSMDVIAKVIYMALIVNVHDAMFSQSGHTLTNATDRHGEGITVEELRAKELRRQMRKQKRAQKERRAAEKAAAEAKAASGGAAPTTESPKDQ